jgi:mono/diheme cytochrome c family protein
LPATGATAWRGEKQAQVTMMRPRASRGLGLILALGGSLAVPVAEVAASAPALERPQVAEGERLALRHCGRCHAVNDRSRFGGIGSTRRSARCPAPTTGSPRSERSTRIPP